MSTVTTILVLLTALALTAALGKRVAVPLPLLLIAAGVGISFVPGFERVDIEPHVFFLLFIPPLLFADGWLIPKREFARVLRPVLLLAFGLVFMTIFGVGLLMHWMIPALPLAAAFALAAIVSPTDAVATSAMVGNAGLPSRAKHILNGESLINDASGLRGSVTMAAALSIPVTLASGAPFPERHVIVFLAASTIVLTLVINGLSLPLFVRALGVTRDRGAERDRRAAEIAIAQAGSAAIERTLSTLQRPEEIAHARDLLAAYSRRTDRHTANAARAIALSDGQATERRLVLLGLEAERRELYALLDAGTINDDTLREIEARLDSAEMHVTGAAQSAH